MYIVLPAIAFAALMLAFAGRGCGVRQSFVYAAAAYTLCLVAATEMLSVWNLLQLPALVGFWAGVAVFAGGYFALYGDRKVAAGALAGAGARFREAPIILSATGVILGVILLVALAAPPNNWDSMTYHMARVAVWMQEGSIHHFPTATLTQLFHPPLAEWNILHLQILSGGDRFANTVQWFALLGCGIGASLLARELRQDFRVQVLAAVIAVTLPTGLLQGSSTQNDLIVAFWLLAFALLAIRYLRAPGAGRLLLCGLALGFALLTKGTTYAVAPPLAAMLLLYGIIRLRRRKGTGYRPYGRLAGAAAVILAVALLLNTGHYARNQEPFGHPLATPGLSSLNEPMNLSAMYVNLVRNSAAHWGVPSYRINAFTLAAVRKFFGDTIDNVPGTHNVQNFFRTGIAFSKHEDTAGNFLHFWLLAAALTGVLLFRKRLQPGALTVCLALAVILGALAFSGILKWETGNTRREVALFMLGAPVVAVFVASLASSRARLPARICLASPRLASPRLASPRLASPRSRVSLWLNRRLTALNTAGGRTGILAGVFLIMCVPWVIGNESRPVIPLDGRSVLWDDRTKMYFNSRPPLLHNYVDAADYIAAQEPETVGLYMMQPESYYYPLWPLLAERLAEMPRLESVGVTNVSGGLGGAGDTPEFIFATGSPQGGFGETAAGESYRIVHILPGVTILARGDVAAAGGLPERTVGDLRDEMIAGGELIISADYDVYVNGNTLIYRRDACPESEVDSWFFLHIVPADRSDLVGIGREHGFQNFDFAFSANGWYDSGSCYALARLPEYEIDRVSTGQYAPGEGGRIWEGAWRPAP